MDDTAPPVPPFVVPEEPREVITQEPQPDGHRHQPWHQDVDWLGPSNMGGGSVPDDFEWRSSPRERQERSSMG